MFINGHTYLADPFIAESENICAKMLLDLVYASSLVSVCYAPAYLCHAWACSVASFPAGLQGNTSFVLQVRKGVIAYSCKCLLCMQCSWAPSAGMSICEHQMLQAIHEHSASVHRAQSLHVHRRCAPSIRPLAAATGSAGSACCAAAI